jgi:hypothetical protein
MEEDKVKNALLSIALVGMLALPALAAPPNQAYPGTAEIDNFNQWETDFGTRTVDPTVYQEQTLGTSYLPGAAGSPTLANFGDDIHTSHSTHPFNMDGPGDGSDFIMSGFRVDWFINDTSGVAGRTILATVRFYENSAADTTFTGIPLAEYNFTDPNTAPGIRNTNVKVNDIQMPADMWMSVAFAFSDGSVPNARKPGVLLANAADWPENPFPTQNAPNGEGGAEVGHSDWWFMANMTTGALSYFGSATTAPPGNLLMSVYGRAVPEPATLGLLAISGLALIRRRR